MPSTNSDGKPTADSIRNSGSIPWASQIRDDSDDRGRTVDESLALGIGRKRVKIEGLSPQTLNNEKSVTLDGNALDQFTPVTAIFHMQDVGSGAAANGDVAVTIGTTSGGTDILTATTLTNLIGINTRFIVDLSAVVKPALAANGGKIYVKVTTADTTAGAGHLVDVYIIGETFASGS